MCHELLFVTCGPVSASQRQKELTYARNKSHIASLAHQKRRRKHERERHSAPLQPDSRRHDLGDGLKEKHGQLSSELRRRHPRLVNPRLMCGNSDPFDTQMIPFTAVTNQLVAFCQYYHDRSWTPSFLPQLASPPAAWRLMLGNSRSAAIPTGKMLWDLFVADQGTFWAVVSSVLPGYRPLVSKQHRRELVKVGLQMKGVGLASLRNLLPVGSGTEPTLNMVYHIKSLFREASMDGDTRAARLHADCLNYLVGRLCAGTQPTHILIRVVLWSDAVPALIQLRRPVIDYDDWLPQLTTAIWKDRRFEHSYWDITEDSPNCVHTGVLQKAFTHFRYALLMTERWIAASQAAQYVQHRERMFQWLTTKAEQHICRLLNLYFDLLQPDAESIFNLTTGEKCTEMGLILALLHLLQKGFHDVTLDNGLDIHESAGAVYQPLKAMMQLARIHWKQSERTFYSKAHIWLLYIGALCEERIRFSNPLKETGLAIEDASHGWFHKEFTQKALLMGLTNWDEVTTVLREFVCSERFALKLRVKGPSAANLALLT